MTLSLLDTSSTISLRSGAPGSTSSSTVRRDEQTEILVGKPSLRPQTAPSSPAPMSLAAFIGGRATGPRLNKHASQLDGTDPTLFEQRNGTSAPHPVFGRGGVAMPGLTSRGREVISPTHDCEVETPTTKHDPSSSTTEPVPIPNGDLGLGQGASRQPRTGSSTALKRYVQHIEQVTSTQASTPPSECDAPRPTTSTPVGAHPPRTMALPPPMSSSRSRPSSPRARIPPGRSNFDARSPPPTSSSISPLEKSPTPPPSNPSAPAFITPKKSATAVTSSHASGVKLPTFSASAQSLPRSEASTPKTTPPISQHRTLSVYPLREKDPTPSISRLKGRGFVQSMVKASSALEAAAVGSVVPEVGNISPAKSSPSIASRWKPESSQSSSSQPATMPVPSHFRKSWTPSAATSSPQRAASQRKSWTTSELQKVEESGRESPTRVLNQQSASSVRLVEGHHTGRSTRATDHEHTGQSSRVPPPEQTERLLRKAASPLPSLTTPSRPSTPPPASPGGHGLGSSSTMFSYIKPVKTGDDPTTGPSLPQSRPTTPHSRASASGLNLTQDVDELGHRTGVSSGDQWQRNGVAAFPAPSGRPLVHVRP
jgi:hypothetical protein